MSTKTIALETGTYERLARLKGQSQSFSSIIACLVDRALTAHTVTDVLAQLDGQAPLSQADANTMARVVRENRANETWPSHDLSGH